MRPSVCESRTSNWFWGYAPAALASAPYFSNPSNWRTHMRKILTSLLMVCFAAVSTVSVAHAKPPVKPVNPVIIIMGTGAAEEQVPLSGPGQTAPAEAKPVNPMDKGVPLPASCRNSSSISSVKCRLNRPRPRLSSWKTSTRDVWYRINSTYYDHDALKDFGVWKNRVRWQADHAGRTRARHQRDGWFVERPLDQATRPRKRSSRR